MTAPRAVIRVDIGPVDAGAAQTWTSHLLANLAVVRARAGTLPFRLPDEVADEFERLLLEWHALAVRTTTFHWTSDLPPDHVRALVRYWANLDSLSDDVVRALGVDWAPPSARPFFEALAAGVADALAAAGPEDRFAELLITHGRRPVRGAWGGRPAPVVPEPDGPREAVPIS